MDRRFVGGKIVSVRGDHLGALLDRLIDEKAGDGPRGDVVDDMASAAGISASTIGQIVGGNIVCPPLDRLRGIADALGVSLSRIQDAAEEDGCNYGDDKEENSSSLQCCRADGSPSITGYASVFYDGTARTEFKLWDGAVERIMPGAFDRAIARADDVRALFNHNPDNLLGRVSSGTLSLRADKQGLRYSITPGDTAMARDVMQHISRGDLRGSSFAFEVTQEEWRKDDDLEVREVADVRLFDVGPVTYPAYESTTTAVRSCDAEGAREARDKWAQDNEERRFERRKVMVRARMVEIG